MGLDTQLIDDRTYFVIEAEGVIAAAADGAGARPCSAAIQFRRTKQRPARSGDRCSPASRAMYTHPDFARRGIGRMILELCERAAAAEGFSRMEMGATLAGEPLYRACGYGDHRTARHPTRRRGVRVPMFRMGKKLFSGDVAGPANPVFRGVPWKNKFPRPS